MSSKIVEKTYEILKDASKRGRILTYGELYDQIGVSTKTADERKRGSQILNEVNEISVLENDVMITAIVVKNDNQLPGNEFFRLATTYGSITENASEEEKKEFWKSELEKVYNIFK